MKKIATLFLLAAAFVLAACTSDDSFGVQSGEAVTVSYTVALPENISTRAYADGTTATYLTYGVYDTETKALVLSEVRNAKFVNLETTVDLTLVKGHTYDIVFWADAGAACPYTIDLEEQTVTMDYASAITGTSFPIDANDENRDAFYCIVKSLDASTCTSTTVTLRRPFAQLNWGTNDLYEDIIQQNYPVASTTFTVTFPTGTLPTVFDLSNGTATIDKGTTNTEAVTFSSQGVPELSNAFPVAGYTYVSMNYILPEIANASFEDSGEGYEYSVTDKASMTVSDVVTLTADLEDVTVSVSNLPLRSNYRTNIYGALLTNPTEFDITIDENFSDHYCIKDGILYYCVESAEEFLAAIANKESNIMLCADIELTTSATITIGTATTLNLNGYTLKISDSSSEAAISSSYDLIILDGALDITFTIDPAVYEPTVYGIYLSSAANLTMDNVTLTITDTTSKIYGVYSNSSGTATITNSEITATSDSNAVYGVFNYGTGTLNISDSEITATSTSGFACSVNNQTGTMNISDCKIISTSTNWYAYGISSSVSTLNINDSEITVTSTNGWVYGAVGTLTITGCTITTTSNSFVYGAYSITGTLNIIDSKIAATGANYDVYGVYNSNSTINISDSEITAMSTDSNAYGAYNRGENTISISGSEITATSTNNYAYGAYNWYTGTITITSTTITSTGATAYNTYNNNSGTITIDGQTATNF